MGSSGSFYSNALSLTSTSFLTSCRKCGPSLPYSHYSMQSCGLCVHSESIKAKTVSTLRDADPVVDWASRKKRAYLLAHHLPLGLLTISMYCSDSELFNTMAVLEFWDCCGFCQCGQLLQIDHRHRTRRARMVETACYGRPTQVIPVDWALAQQEFIIGSLR